ncbi:MAG: hypothetical protein LBT95_08090 [Treponema sp.]|jgi:hypothetical protein|nr:hypothetical protein [Treponema sp.]
MAETQKTIQQLDEAGRAHINSMHRLGRVGAVLALIIMLGIPTIAGIYFDAMPGFLQVMLTAAGLLSLFVPAALSEVIAYTPILGSSIYLTLITGNVMNLKLPVANNALALLDVESGTEDADLVTSIAVSVSTFFTLVIIFIGVLLILPLQPVLTLPAVRTASSYIVPALFGSLTLGALGSGIGGGIRAPGRMKGAIVPAILVIALYVLIHHVFKVARLWALYQGIIILILLPVAYFGTKLLYKKGQIKVLLPGEEA